MCLDKVCDQASNAVGSEVTANLQTWHLGTGAATEVVLCPQVCGQTTLVFVHFLAQVTEDTTPFHHNFSSGQVTGWIAVVTLLSTIKCCLVHAFHHLLKYNVGFSLDVGLLTQIYAIPFTLGGWQEGAPVLHFLSTSSRHSTNQENIKSICSNSEQKK